MALPDLTGQNIQDTYQRILTVGDGGHMFDGTGSIFVPLSASVEVTKEVSSSHADTASYIDTSNIAQPFNNITSSGAISASGPVTITQLRANGRIYTNYNLSNEHFLRNTTVSNPMVSAVGGFHTNGNVTASGDISSSGTITGIINGGTF